MSVRMKLYPYSGSDKVVAICGNCIPVAKADEEIFGPENSPNLSNPIKKSIQYGKFYICSYCGKKRKLVNVKGKGGHYGKYCLLKLRT